MPFRKTVVHLLKWSITIATLGWIIYKYGFNNIVDTFLHARWTWIWVGFSLNLLSIVLGAFQWHALLANRKNECTMRRCIKVYFSGIFFNNFIFGSVIGDAFRIGMLHLDNQKSSGSFAATFLDRFAGLLVLCFFALVGGCMILFRNVQQDKELDMVLVALFVFFGIFFGLFLFLISKRLQNITLKVISHLPENRIRFQIERIMGEIFIDRRGKKEKQLLLQVGGYSLLIQWMRVVVHICSALALGLFSWPTVHYFFVIIPIIALLMIIPLPFGVREAIGGTLFGLAGFSLQQAVLMEFLATMIGIVSSLPGGIMFLADKRSVDGMLKKMDTKILRKK